MCNKPPEKKLKQINTRIPLIKCGYIYSSLINACPTNEFLSSTQSRIFEHHVCCGGTRDVTTCHLPCRQSQRIWEGTQHPGCRINLSRYVFRLL